MKLVYGVLAATCLTLSFSDFAYAQAAPGATGRCQASLNRCLDGPRGNNAGLAAGCRRTYEACVSRAESSGSAYRRCMAAAKTAADKAKCRANYSN